MSDIKNSYIARRKAGLASGALSRRQFVSSMLAAGVVLPTALGWADRAQAAPQKGGFFKLGTASGSTTDTLNPATFETTMGTLVAYSLYNNLMEVDEQGQLIPELATAAESEDARTWRFPLREGVTFHNGKSLEPEDVVASFNHHRGEDTTSAATGLVKQIKEIRIDGNTVVFELVGPNADFPYLVTDYHLGILPSEGGALADPNGGIGTGGYILENYEPGVRLQLTRNPDYFKEGRAHFDDVEVIAIIDGTARQNAVMTGNVDAIDRVDPKTVSLLGRVPTLNIVELTSSLHYTFPMRLDAEPFGDPNMRKAVKLAIDRQEMLDKILLGHGGLGNDHPIASFDRFFNTELPQREYDPEKAKFYFDKTGFSGTLKLRAAEAAFAGAVDAAQLLAASAGKAGMDVEVVREPNDGYWSNVWNKKPFCASYWGGRPTPDWMYSSGYLEDIEWNETAWRDTPEADKFNKLVKQARAELDFEKRKDMYWETQRLINEDCGTIVAMFANHIMALDESIGHDENMGANWELDGGKAPERWWKKS